MALLWSDRGEAQARPSLRQALSGLRKALGPASDDLLGIDADAITLNPGAVHVRKSGGDVLLMGLRVTDPAFDAWLRDERLHAVPGASSKVKSIRAPIPQIPSIAVLPFRNMSQIPDDDGFSDGMTQNIVTA